MFAIHYTYHASLHSKEIDTFYMINILQVNHPPQKFPDKNVERNDQHEETDKPTKHHMYSNIISKWKFHMAHKPQNRNHSDKNVLAERQYLHKSKHTYNTTQKKCKTVVCTWQQN